ncbi:MAG TPA: sigma 54-interacting transcriptional regulator [Clostridia bacterium]|nr:sigma 54-interacting transcriptional regulator [Clostridia bacterium]
MYKIAVIYSAYPEIEEAANELIRNKEYYVEIAIGVLDKAVELAKRYQAGGFDLIISRGVTGVLIRSAVSIPVILVDITNFDIIRTLYNARQYGKKLAFLQYSRGLKYHDFDFIREILGMNEDELQILYFRNDGELQEQVNNANNSSVDVIIATGAYILELARQQGFKTIMVRSTKEAIYNAFQQAEDILNFQHVGQELYRYFQLLSEASPTGLIFLDACENVRYVSGPAGNLLKIDTSRTVNRKFADLCAASPALKGLVFWQNTGQIHFEGTDLLVKKLVLHQGDKVTGYAIEISYPTASVTVADPRNNEGLRNQGLVARYHFCDIVGNSEAITKTITKAKSYGKTDLTILITGESGTGKEVLANSIHNVSARKDRPFVAVNCATLPQSLLESELFGYEDGAFTGAKRGGRLGLFEMAQGGTIFLDEISEITMPAQAQLLRVLQEKVIRRVGGNKIISVDVRVIAASNADLLERIKTGQFREDLFYRLNVLNIRIPPLRERKEDIPLLIKYFLEKQADSAQDVVIPELFMRKLQAYKWPGNIRELENFVDKFAILSQDTQNGHPLWEDLFMDFSHYERLSQSGDQRSLNIKIDTLRRMELQIIEMLYERYGGDKSELARMLGISRSNLWSKLKILGKEEEI